ncbi:cytochrome P450 [Streptomyces glomeratus]|uniref:Cytochrome P450 n=1 Tax=Streptomyces glomeratus TaxID=284452 RepID=A0ABP6M0L6_9ACTN|nr:cytochrome P450 [Streptomyces glomeratus]MCF1510133.1 cytochrome P450 [Streptomyces glomeratus]
MYGSVMRVSPSGPQALQHLTEVLRLYQPNWFMMWRTTRPTAIRSVPLPEGAELILSAAALHRGPAAFPDPLRFDPGRWPHLTERDLPRGAYIPFVAGNRKCIGDTPPGTRCGSRWRPSRRVGGSTRSPGIVSTPSSMCRSVPTRCPCMRVTPRNDR